MHRSLGRKAPVAIGSLAAVYAATKRREDVPALDRALLEQAVIRLWHMIAATEEFALPRLLGHDESHINSSHVVDAVRNIICDDNQCVEVHVLRSTRRLSGEVIDEAMPETLDIIDSVQVHALLSDVIRSGEPEQRICDGKWTICAPISSVSCIVASRSVDHDAWSVPECALFEYIADLSRAVARSYNLRLQRELLSQMEKLVVADSEKAIWVLCVEFASSLDGVDVASLWQTCSESPSKYRLVCASDQIETGESDMSLIKLCFNSREICEDGNSLCLYIPARDQEFPMQEAKVLLLALNRCNYSNDSFSADTQIDVVKRLCTACSVASSRLLLTVSSGVNEKKVRGLLSLRRFSANVHSGKDFRDMLECLVQVTKQTVDADRMNIFFVDQKKRTVWNGVSEDIKEHISIPFGKGIIGYVALTGSIVNIPDVRLDDRFNDAIDKLTCYTTKSILCCPVMDRGGQTVAVAMLINKRIEDQDGYFPFSSRDEEILLACCSEIANCIRSLMLTSIWQGKISADVAASSLIESYMNPPSQTLHRTSSGDSEQIVDHVSDLLQLRKLLDVADFDVFDHSLEKLEQIASLIFESFGLLQEYSIGKSQLRWFSNKIRTGYHDVPFHNFRHAFSVLQLVYIFLVRCPAMASQLGRLNIFALLVAAIGHDIDHPGHTNKFEIDSCSERALLYNDRSVLENHHCSTLFQILRHRDTNIFSNVVSKDQRTLRNAIVYIILQTDMSHHFDNCEKLATVESIDEFLRCEEIEKHHFIMGIITHAADLSSQVLNLRLAKKWECRISEEFRQQARRERELGLPVAAYMDNLIDVANRARLQANFIEYVLDPLWSQIFRLFPEMQDFHANLRSNLEYYQRLITGTCTKDLLLEMRDVPKRQRSATK